MRRTNYIALATLALCALAIPARSSTLDAVARPFLGKATTTWTVNMQNGSATGYETGVATHIGLYVNESSGTWDLVSFVFTGAGVVTTADGERVSWIMTPDRPGIVQVTGGTGRFENAAGSLTTVSMEPPIITVDPVTMTMTMTITYTAAGTLLY